MDSLAILGRQPEIGLAELESLYGDTHVQPVGRGAAIVKVDPCRFAFDRLGGAVKFCKLLTTLDTTNWKQIEKFLLQVSPGHSQQMTEGKMHLGLSAIGFDVSLKQLEATGLSLKKAIRKTDRPVRLVPNKELELSSAQVLHNRLTGSNGWELYLIRDGQKTIVAQTVKVQDIESYTQRDRGRPKRDSRVGMLPPKLAQIIINLAAGKLPEDKLANICDIPDGETIPRPQLDQTVLDPFCGTGVILQEAALMGYGIYGSDLEPRMMEYSKTNLDWLKKNTSINTSIFAMETGDATSHKWHGQIDMVASETYLGRPFTSYPNNELLNQTVSECNLIIKKFLRNIHGQLKPNSRLCLAIPAWQAKNGHFKYLPLLDSLEELGYNQLSFEHAGVDKLLYYREDQIVARQLLILQRK